MTQIDTKKDPTTKLVFDILAERQRSRARTDIKNLFRQALKAEPKLDYQDFLSVFKNLDAANFGKLIIGRRRNPDRFAWSYDLKDVATKVKANGISATTLKHLELVKPESVRNVQIKAKRGRKPNVRVSKPRAKKEAVMSSNAVTEVIPTVIQIQLPEMSQADRVALFKILTGSKE